MKNESKTYQLNPKEKNIIFCCPAQKKDCTAENAEKAAKIFMCNNCLEFKNKNCSGALVKNKNEDLVRSELRKLAEHPKAKRAPMKRLAMLFYKEIKAARDAGYGGKAIAKILKKYGYAETNWGNGINYAFKKVSHNLENTQLEGKENGK